MNFGTELEIQKSGTKCYITNDREDFSFLEQNYPQSSMEQLVHNFERQKKLLSEWRR